MAHVELRHLKKHFGAVEVIDDLSLDVEAGEFCALLGPSGCGKSTLLRMIAGLETVTAGTVTIAGRDVTQVPPAKRQISMVFQSYALYPHMSVRQNIGFGLDIARMPKPEIAQKVAAASQMLQLQDYLDRKPAQLSGGQRQRVAIGRALVRDPEVFLFDEPLSNLDAKLRVQMRLELAKLHQELETTMIYVTHDQIEAMTLADRIVVLDAGRIAQVGTPLDLYHRPQNRFVASFIGSPAMNFFAVSPTRGEGKSVEIAHQGGAPFAMTTRNALAGDRSENYELGVRPEHLMATGPDDAMARFRGKIGMVEQLGNTTLLYVDTDAGTLLVETDSESEARIGDAVGVGIDVSRAHLFGPDGAVV